MAEGGPRGREQRELAISIHKADKARGYEVLIDGHHVENAVVNALYQLDPSNGPLLVLSLATYGAIDIEGPTCVAVDAPTHKALVAMGWTPPGGAMI
jgi:hypothetical protein